MWQRREGPCWAMRWATLLDSMTVLIPTLRGSRYLLVSCVCGLSDKRFTCVVVGKPSSVCVWGGGNVLEVVFEKNNSDLSSDVNVSQYFKRLIGDQPQQY